MKIDSAEQVMSFVKPYTMVSEERLKNVFELGCVVELENVPGAFVECGVWKGGVVALMAWMAQRRKPFRRTWVFDSFKGLPEPLPVDGQKAKEYSGGRVEGKLTPLNLYSASRAEVEGLLFDSLSLDRESIVVVEGWFQDTVPACAGAIDPISILRLDGDWYESTRTCLEGLYDRISPGGFVIIDDYGFWEGCRRATDEFLKKRSINTKLVEIDDTGVYFQKA